MLAGLGQGSGCLRFLSRDDKTLSNAESTLVTGRVTRGVFTMNFEPQLNLFLTWGNLQIRNRRLCLTSQFAWRKRGTSRGRGDGSVTWDYFTPCLGQTWEEGGFFEGGPGTTNDLLETLTILASHTGQGSKNTNTHYKLTSPWQPSRERQTTVTVKW